MINIVSDIDARIRVIDKMAQKVESFSGLTAEQVSEQIDDELLSVYQQAHKPREQVNDMIYGENLSVGAAHAKAYYPKALESFEKAKENFRNIAKPYDEQFKERIRVKEEIYRVQKEQEMQEEKAKKEALLAENDKMIEEIKQLDPNPLLGKYLSIPMYKRNNKLLKNSLSAFKKCEEKDTDGLKSMFQNELGKGEDGSSLYTMSTFNVMLASKYADELKPVFKEYYTKYYEENPNDRASYSSFEREVLEELKLRQEQIKEQESKENVENPSQLGEE